MNERRRWKRRHLLYYLKVFEDQGSEPLGFLVDVTGQGIMLMSENALDTSRPYSLYISIETELLPARDIYFSAKALWSRQDSQNQFFDTGFEITKASPDDMQALEYAIDRLAFRDD
jgi:hypothetical protein